MSSRVFCERCEVMHSYDDIDSYVRQNMLIKKDNFGYHIEAIYAKSEEDLRFIIQYFELAHSYNNYRPTYDGVSFKGPDWYFDFFIPGDRESPEEARLVTLTEKKERFKAMCDELDHLVENFEKEKGK